MGNDILSQLKERKKQLQLDKAAVDKELKNVTKAIEIMEGEVKRYLWPDRGIECLTKQDQMMQTNEILECVLFKTPEDLADPDKKRLFTVALSVGLTSLCRIEKVKKIIIPRIKGHFYGLIEWFDKKGELLPGYQDKLDKKIKSIKQKLP